MRPHGHDRHRALERQIHRQWGVAAGAAHEDGRVPGDAEHGIVVARRDLPIVQQKRVCQPGEPPQCIRIPCCDRLLTGIAAGHHERPVGRLEQQVMQRGVRQHHTHRVEARSNRGGERRVRVAAHQDDGALARSQ
jgi:hypothetical protein